MSESEQAVRMPVVGPLLRANLIASYAWAICYAPGIASRIVDDHSLPLTYRLAGAFIGLLLAPLIAPSILIAAPIAAIVQNRPLMPVYFVALAAYVLTAAIVFRLRREKERQRLQQP